MTDGRNEYRNCTGGSFVHFMALPRYRIFVYSENTMIRGTNYTVQTERNPSINGNKCSDDMNGTANKQ